MSANMIAPVLALVLWSLVMLIWMVAVRLPALSKVKLSSEQARGGRGQDLDRILPPQSNWPAHNYVHLMEQPTIFYATALAIAVLGQGTTINVALAWTYVALRVIHSVWQAKVNTIPVRASLFFLSTFVLVALASSGMISEITH
jgi:hypothetical protein